MNSAHQYQKNTESDMMRLWNAHQDVVDDVIKKYRFIEPHARDDYRQEMFMSVFEKFYEWSECQKKGIRFTGWLYVRCRNAAFNYRRQFVKSREKNIFFYGRYKYSDQMETIPLEDEKYEEDDITALNKAVSDLEPDDQKVIQMFYDGVPFRNGSHAEGKSSRHYSDQFIKIRNHLRVIKGRYWEGKVVYIKRYPNKARNRDGVDGADMSRFQKAVLQIDFTGNVIKEWPSIVEVSEQTGIHKRSLQNCFLGHECVSSGGYIWLLKTDIDKLPERMKRFKKNGGGKRRLARPIEQWSADGELIKCWPSLLSTKEAGFNPGNIHNAIKNGKTAGGFRWCYSQAAENSEQVAA